MLTLWLKSLSVIIINIIHAGFVDIVVNRDISQRVHCFFCSTNPAVYRGSSWSTRLAHSGRGPVEEHCVPPLHPLTGEGATASGASTGNSSRVLSSGECHQQYGLTGILGKFGGRHRHMLDARARPSGQAFSRGLLGKSQSSQPRAVAAKGLGSRPSDVPPGHYNSPNPTTELTTHIECG